MAVKRIDYEHFEQKAIFLWIEAKRQKYPDLTEAYAIPNGGDRHVVVATKLKAEGVQKGMPDICLPVARGGYHALYIELKVKGDKVLKITRGTLKPHQKDRIERLLKQGNLAVCCWGQDDAKDLLMRYIEGKEIRTDG